MSDPEARQLRQRVAVYGVALDAGQVLLVRASALAARLGAWWLPGGGLEFGESLEDCLRREWLEETGLSIRVDPLFTAMSDVTDLPDGPLHSIRLIYPVTPIGANSPRKQAAAPTPSAGTRSRWRRACRLHRSCTRC